jgi:hypothetical protein
VSDFTAYTLGHHAVLTCKDCFDRTSMGEKVSDGKADTTGGKRKTSKSTEHHYGKIK